MTRPWLGALALVLVGLFGHATMAVAAVASLTTFGDSYTQSMWYTVPTWAEQLRRAGAVRSLRNYARAGATAGGLDHGRSTFDGQLDEWARAGRPLSQRTVVYFGYNDINKSYDLARSGQRYAAGIDRLLQAGANSGGRHVLLMVIHDWSTTPAGQPGQHQKVLSWNATVRAAARARGLRTIDLFGKITAVRRDPAAYGFTDVTSPSRSNPRHLYFDAVHFGARGQAVIAATARTALQLP